MTLCAQLEFGYRESLSLEAMQIRFERYGEKPAIGSMLRKLDEALIGTVLIGLAHTMT